MPLTQDNSSYPILGDLVLVGGGHAQVAVLKSFAMHPVPGLRLTLVTRDINTPYSGMLPAFVEGVWSNDDIHIDLVRLAQMAGARLIHDSVIAIDPDAKRIEFSARPAIPFDILSLNIGGEPDLDAIVGARQNAVPVKPISKFRDRLDNLLKTGFPEHLAVIGGGAAACELALSLSQKWVNETGKRPHIRLYARSARLVPEMPPRAARLLYETLTKANCSVQCGVSVESLTSDRLTLNDETSHGFDTAFLVTAVRPPAWLAQTGLNLDGLGFVKVSSTLQSTSHPFIFAAGDIAALTESPRPKSGVYAVRAGPVLAHNLRQYALGRRLQRWKPQSKALALLGTADGAAIAVRGNHASKSRSWWWLKKWIDRRWMAKYTALSMKPPPDPKQLAGISAPVEKNTPADPVFDSMRCLGCGAKTGHATLQNAMNEAIEIALSMGADPDLMPSPDLNEDSAVLKWASDGEMVQSVDSLSEIVSDPFRLGRISAVHAMSDIYAANALPAYGLANVTLKTARADLQQGQLAQLMAGSLLAFNEAGARLVGGHTSESDALNIGFSVTGWRSGPPKIPTQADRPVLLLTKPLGTGVIMSGHMSLLAHGNWVEAALNTMSISNGGAADILSRIAPPMTDVTGFGLARHAMNLAERCELKGVVIDIDALPILDGASTLISDGQRSSLHGHNRAAIRIDAGGGPMPPNAEIIFDPQTSGGLLAALPEADADGMLAALLESGHDAAIIGHLTSNYTGLRLQPAGGC